MITTPLALPARLARNPDLNQMTPLPTGHSLISENRPATSGETKQHHHPRGATDATGESPVRKTYAFRGSGRLKARHKITASFIQKEKPQEP
jgi:hypothetical protein